MRQTFSSAKVLICLAFLAVIKPSHAQSIGAIVGGISSNPTSLGVSSLFWNPAVIGQLSGTQVESHLGFLSGEMNYDRDGTNSSTGGSFGRSSTLGIAPSVFFGASSGFTTDNWRFAYGTYFPSGSMAKFDAAGPQRYDLIEGMLIPWHHQFVVAYKINQALSVAASFIFSVSFFETELAVDLSKVMRKAISKEIPAEHAAVSPSVKVPMTWAPGFGGALGVYYRPHYQWSFGFAGYTPVRYSYSGKLQFQSPELAQIVSPGLSAVGLESQNSVDISARSSLPAFFNVGMRYQPFGYWSQEYFGRYILSSLEKSLSLKSERSSIEALDTLNVEGQSLEDSWTIGTVQNFPLWQSWRPALYSSFYKNGVPESSLAVSRIDFDSWNVGGILRYRPSDRLEFSLDYMHSFMFSRHPKSVTPSSSSDYFEAPSSAGRFSANMDRASFQVKYVF